jgi:hypothetical protein
VSAQQTCAGRIAISARRLGRKHPATRKANSSFNEPSEPIPLEVSALTGITNEMVVAQRIDEAAVSSFVDDAVIEPRKAIICQSSASS